MTPTELLAAKRSGSPVFVRDGRVGKVNGIGNTRSCVYFPVEGRVTFFPNEDMCDHDPYHPPR